MTFEIFCKNDTTCGVLKKKYIDLLTGIGFTLSEKAPDYCLIIGGDGAVLRAVHKYIDSLEKTHFIAIHHGTLGFFADFKNDEPQKLIDLLKSKEYNIKKLALLQTDITSQKDKVSTLYSFNEVTIQNFTQTMICDVLIDDRYLETFRGTGFCISTPSGSTAYNKGLGGAIVYRDIDAIQLTEIASINHNKYHSLNAPLVMGNSHKITIKPVAQSNISITADCNYWIDKMVWLKDADDELKSIDCFISNKVAKFIQPKDACYIKKLNRCFII